MANANLLAAFQNAMGNALNAGAALPTTLLDANDNEVCTFPAHCCTVGRTVLQVANRAGIQAPFLASGEPRARYMALDTGTVFLAIAVGHGANAECKTLRVNYIWDKGSPFCVSVFPSVMCIDSAGKASMTQVGELIILPGGPNTWMNENVRWSRDMVEIAIVVGCCDDAGLVRIFDTLTDAARLRKALPSWAMFSEAAIMNAVSGFNSLASQVADRLSPEMPALYFANFNLSNLFAVCTTFLELGEAGKIIGLFPDCKFARDNCSDSNRTMVTKFLRAISFTEIDAAAIMNGEHVAENILTNESGQPARLELNCKTVPITLALLIKEYGHVPIHTNANAVGDVARWFGSAHYGQWVSTRNKFAAERAQGSKKIRKAVDTLVDVDGIQENQAVLMEGNHQQAPNVHQQANQEKKMDPIMTKYLNSAKSHQASATVGNYVDGVWPIVDAAGRVQIIPFIRKNGGFPAKACNFFHKPNGSCANGANCAFEHSFTGHARTESATMGAAASKAVNIALQAAGSGSKKGKNRNRGKKQAASSGSGTGTSKEGPVVPFAG